MSRLTWGAPEERFYESGVDRGVLYVGLGDGVAWNGLISVAEHASGGEAKPAYIDGQKFRNISSSEEFEATIEAFSAPAEFGPCDGSVSIQNGLFATQQPRKSFSFSYRTKVGNALSENLGYKIHLVYNALASPSSRTNATLGGSTDANPYSWDLTTLPPSLTGMKPTAHLVIDSRTTPKTLLATVEDILYGSDVATARLPQPSELSTLFKSQGPLIATNLVLNPSMNSTNGRTVIRRNLAVDPAATANSATTVGWAPLWYGASPAAGTTTLVKNAVDGPIGLTSYMRKTWTAVPSAVPGDVGFSHGPTGLTGIAVTPGDVYAASTYVRNNKGDKETRIRFNFYNSSGTEVTSARTFGTGVTATPAKNTWTRISGTVTVPAGVTTMNVWTNVYPTGANYAIGDTIDGTGLLIEKASTVGAYFDGAIKPAADADLTVLWSGTANASQSTYGGPLVAHVQGIGTITPQVQSTIHSLFGSFSLRCVGQGNNTSVATDTAPSFAVSGSAEVTVSAWFWCDVDQTVTPAARFATNSNGTFLSYVYGPAAVVPAGVWTEVRAVLVVPATATHFIPRFDLGGIASPNSVWVDGMMAVAGDYAGTYFDGSTMDENGNIYAWTGAADASTSTLNSWN